MMQSVQLTIKSTLGANIYTCLSLSGVDFPVSHGVHTALEENFLMTFQDVAVTFNLKPAHCPCTLR